MIWAPFQIKAANTGKIVGSIKDETNDQPLVGANILIRNTSLGSSSDENGQFVILNVHPGTYSVQISYIGYTTVIKTDIQVQVDNTTWMDVSLKPSVIEGTTVTVTADKPIIEKGSVGSKQVASSEKFEKEPLQTVSDILETQAGVFQGTYRGDSQVQMVYMLNDISVNSGLFSDNFTGFNLSAIQEIAVLTGGYSAEYGDARAAVVNVVEKMNNGPVEGSFLMRLRPAGKYHYGRNMYSNENYDHSGFGIEYWTKQTENPASKYFGEDPTELLQAWQEQIVPDPIQGDYTERHELSYEGTLYGGLTENMNFLLSGRFINGVSRYPQGIPYNPEMNIQGYINYDITPNIIVKLGGFVGYYESAESKGANFDSWEGAQEHQWLGQTTVTTPYSDAKYNPMGVIYDHYPELRQWQNAYIKLTHTLNERSLYRFTASYLFDHMNRSDRDDVVPDSLWSRRDDTYMMVPNFRLQGYFHAWDDNVAEVMQYSFDYTNQYLPNQQLKFGLGLKQFDFEVEHFMASYEGGGRWNLMNVFSGTPYEGHAFLQELIEYPGIVLNGGVRLDFFNQNREASANMFDPLAMQPSTPGHVEGQPLGIPGTPETLPTELQWRLSPRLGISHPMSDRSILRFSYGHFYQRPSWSKMFGFPFVNYTENMSTVLDPFASNDTLLQETYMEEWQGFYGNPELSYERSVQYEVGLEYAFRNSFLIKATGYYKDSDMEANVITGLYAKEYVATKAFMVSNGGYSDTRGMEIKVDSRFTGLVNFGVSYDIYWNFRGEVGYTRLNEPGSSFIDLPIGLNSSKGNWSGFQKVKGWMSLDIPKGGGPELMGMHPFGDLHIYSYTWWRSGDPYTYHAPGDLSTRENNRRWFNIYETDMKISKGIGVGKTRFEISADMRNIFNHKFIRRLYGDELKYYHENPNLPLEERLPVNSFSREANVWHWYSYEVAPREIYIQLRMDF